MLSYVLGRYVVSIYYVLGVSVNEKVCNFSKYVGYYQDTFIHMYGDL